MLRIEGTFSKSGGGKIGIDFSGFDASAFIEDGTVLELITANALEGFSEDANDDFAAKNLLNGFADFEWAGNTLTVSFSAVPEPAAIAAILGAVALVSPRSAEENSEKIFPAKAPVFPEPFLRKIPRFIFRAGTPGRGKAPRRPPAASGSQKTWRKRGKMLARGEFF